MGQLSHLGPYLFSLITFYNVIKILDLAFVMLYLRSNRYKQKPHIMSVIKGPFDFTGSFGNLRVYDDPATGKRIIAEKGGPTAEQFWNHPNYAMARENIKEFAGRSTWASLLKKSLSDIGHLMYVRCFNQIMSAGYHILQQDDISTVGSRNIAVSNDPAALLGLDFNKRCQFKTVLRKIYETSLSPDKTTVTLSIPNFVTSRDTQWITKFVAVRFYLVIAQISDMALNTVINAYEPLVRDLEVLSKCKHSDWFMRNSQPAEVNLEVSFDQPALTLPGTAVIAAIGVEFSTELIFGEPCVKSRNGSMAIVGCYTE